MGHWPPGMIAALAGLFHVAVLLGLLALVESNIRPLFAGRIEPLPAITVGTILRLVPAIFLAQLVHLVSVFRAMGTRQVWWRGVRYQIDGPWNVRMIEDSRAPSLESVEAIDGNGGKKLTY
jgi:hypothetical protein